MGIFNEHNLRGISSGQRGQRGQRGERGLPGQKGDKGDPGIGFELTSDGNYHMDNKKIYNLDSQDDFEIGVDYDTMVKDLKSADNKEYLNDKFLKKDKGGNYFDLRQNVVRNTEPFYDGLFGDKNLVSKKFVDTEIVKLDGANALLLNGSKLMTKKT